MSRLHDMGGRFGDGPVRPEAHEPVFKEDWHKRACALTVACGFLGKWNIDTSRHARECLSPQDYARFSYYEKWLAALANLLVAEGLVTKDELAAAAGAPSPVKALAAADVAEALARGGPTERAGPQPIFTVGQHVKTRAARNPFVPGGHTRLPTYAAQTQGQIVRCHGCHVLPDSNAHGRGEAAEPLYAVSFRAGDLWQAPEHPEDSVVLDMWQSYLEPA